MVNVLLKYFGQMVPILLALCLMLLATYYAQNYAGIIGLSLMYIHFYEYSARVDPNTY